jgi:hypothetical protein
MADTPEPGATPSDPQPTSGVTLRAAATSDVDTHHRAVYALLAVLLGALLFGGWGLWKTFAPGVEDPQALVRRQQATIDALEQRVATLARSDQISREANNDLQGTLAERDEEIAGLRADVAFYERFVGATGQRRGLSVHELKLQPQTEQAWHFTATLTQNINRGAVRGVLVQVLPAGGGRHRAAGRFRAGARARAAGAGARIGGRAVVQLERCDGAFRRGRLMRGGRPPMLCA